MSCSCKRDTEVKLAEFYGKELGPDAVDVKAELGGYGIVFGKTPSQRGYLEARITAQVPRKAGGMKPMTKRTSMFFSYCPFCGTKIEAE